MADFCHQCCIEMFGKDHQDLAGLSTEAQTKQGLSPVVICEGCGMTQVDHEGTCISPDCHERHGQPQQESKGVAS